MIFDKKEMKQYEDQFDWLEPGKEARINHATSYCSGSSKSLKIKKNSDGSISVRCYRCGGWGKIGGHIAPRVINHKTIPLSCSRIIQLPKDIIPRMGVKQAVWINSYGITKDELKKYGIVYYPKHNSIIFPIFKAGTLVGYQERHFNPDMPKYTTVTFDKQSLWWNSNEIHDTVVIVEDILSGIKVGRYASSMAILGTHLSDSMLGYIGQFRQAIVWLDNDNSIVNMKREQIANRISTLVEDVNVIRKLSDPKGESDETIRSTIDGN